MFTLHTQEMQCYVLTVNILPAYWLIINKSCLLNSRLQKLPAIPDILNIWKTNEISAWTLTYLHQ